MTLRLAPCSSPAPSHEVAFKYHQIISNPVDDAFNIFIKCVLSRVFPSSRSPCLVDPWKKATGKVSQRLSNSRIDSLVGQAPTREAVKSETCFKKKKRCLSIIHTTKLLTIKVFSSRVCPCRSSAPVAPGIMVSSFKFGW